MNTHRIKGSPSAEFHRKHFGKLDYLDAFVPRFNKGIREWSPSAWANLFKKAGARYVVLTSKHHDGFTLWPSNVANPYRTESEIRLDRDIVGELGDAVRHAGMRYGLYYSGGMDWSFPGSLDGHCKTCHYRPRKPQNPEEYSDYATEHLWELMEKYKPCILWNDINYPTFKKNERLFEIFAHFYSKVCPGHGLINNRWKLDGNWKGDFAELAFPSGIIGMKGKRKRFPPKNSSPCSSTLSPRAEICCSTSDRCQTAPSVGFKSSD